MKYIEYNLNFKKGMKVNFKSLLFKIISITTLFLSFNIESNANENLDIDVSYHVSQNRKYVEFWLTNYEKTPVKCDWIRTHVFYVDAVTGQEFGRRTVSVRNIYIEPEGEFHDLEVGKDVIHAWESTNRFAEISRLADDIQLSCQPVKGFLDYCKDHSVGEETKTTIKEMKNVVGYRTPHGESCEEAFAKIRTLNKIDLTWQREGQLPPAEEEFRRTKIVDLEPFTALNHLKSLNLSYNIINDISPLSSLHYLSELKLNGNNITDFSPLEKSTQLKSLDITRNRNANLFTISKLTSLESLYLNESSANDLDFLKNFKHLKHLSFSHNTIVDLSPIENLKELEFLDARGNQIVRLNPISSFTNLKHLSLGWNKIHDISSIKDMINLEYLDISSNEILELILLNRFIKLKELRISENNIFDLEVIGSLVNLETLILAKNRISNIDALSGMTKLRILDLTDNQINEISQLRNFQELTHIYLSYNKIRNLMPLVGLTKLVAILAYRNPIDLSMCPTDSGSFVLKYYCRNEVYVE